MTLKSFKNVSPVIPLKGRIVEDWKILILQIIVGLEEGKLCIISDVSLCFLCNNYFVEM